MKFQIPWLTVKKIYQVCKKGKGKVLIKDLTGKFALKAIQNCEAGFKIQSYEKNIILGIVAALVRVSDFSKISFKFVLLEIMHTKFT